MYHLILSENKTFCGRKVVGTLSIAYPGGPNGLYQSRYGSTVADEDICYPCLKEALKNNPKEAAK